MTPKPRKTTPARMPDREILNIDDAASFLGVSVKTFSKVLREGDVPARKVGREWKFSRQALVDWVGGSKSRAFLDGAEEGGRDRPRAGAKPRRRRRRLSAADDYSVDAL